MSVATNFDNYRALYDNQPIEKHSLETLGITSENDFDKAMADSQGVILPFEGGSVPIVTRLENLHDRNLDLYRRLGEQAGRGEVDALYYYSHLAFLDSPRDRLEPTLEYTMRSLANVRGLLAYDAARGQVEQTDAEVRELITRIGGIACDLVAGMPEHHHYLMLLRRPGGDDYKIRQLDFPSLHQNAIAHGAVKKVAQIDVVGTLPESDCEHIAGYYGAQHELLTRHDATDAGFSPESLRYVLTDPRYTKIIYRHMGNVANLTILADPHDCPWIDQAFVEHQYPYHYEHRRMLIAIGAISDPNAPVGLTRATVAMGGRLIAYAGGDVALGIATDDVSDAYVPHISVEVLRHVGLIPQIAPPSAESAPDVDAKHTSTGERQPGKPSRQPVIAMTGVAFRAVVLRPAS